MAQNVPSKCAKMAQMQKGQNVPLAKIAKNAPTKTTSDIAENVERRGQAEIDPMKKARIAAFLKEYWGVLAGRGGDRRSKDKMPLKTLKDISEELGEEERTVKRLLKLNDLIPELKALVSSGKLGTTAAEQLAYLTEDEQRALFDALGESVAKTTVAEAGKISRSSACFNAFFTSRNSRTVISSTVLTSPVDGMTCGFSRSSGGNEEIKYNASNPIFADVRNFESLNSSRGM